ncbi:hypothetical protein SCATT_23750 [Streptantibioticus cattleyicolor NRRL 8057 = DSM 46488]|uniref:Uncharacterized protein n=1 Tax=Streptantibioticus cattleyicolor (strain ATCC 35852 / DSM 46488 / JCM 4925 / NBRC 14057 / NRRL 8057) TaxID=1003195 RepID=G8WRY6_STREN|nr:hypothetical protein SCATT_23750 [Streptantibioticus cattleyicolor NRRL 8057 = DSM 46488]
MPDGTYRPLPIPREPHVPAARDAREGVVLPAQGDSWEQPAPVVQPAAGRPWGDAPPPAAPPGQPPFPPGHGAPTQPGIPAQGPADADATRVLTPYGTPPPPSADSEKTQFIPPFQDAGDQADATRRLLSRPLPPEQRFEAPVPPLPAGPPTVPSVPFAVRPGVPQGPVPSADLGDPVDQPTQVVPAPLPDGTHDATRQLPLTTDDPWQPAASAPAGPPPPAAGPPQGQDDYDYLYRQDGVAPPADRAPYRPTVPRPERPRPGFGAPTQGAGVQPPRPAQPFGQPPVPPGYRPAGGTGAGAGPADVPAPAGGRRKPSRPVLIGAGIAVLAAVGIATGAALSGGGNDQPQKAGATAPAASSGATGDSADPAADQAKRLDALLATSNSSRATVINAVETIKNCGDLHKAAADLRSAAGQRDDLVAKLGGLDLGRLPGHDQLTAQLTAAWKASAAADNHYAAWADQVAADKKGCHKGHARITGQAQQANASSGDATAAKKRAAGLWNPIASRYGLTQREFTQL